MSGKRLFNSSDGTKLVGLLETPDIKTSKCVILCHGLKTSKDEYGSYIKLSNELVKSGYAVFRFDFRAHGESEGIDYEMTVEKEIEDLDAAYKVVIGDKFSDISLLGGSFGGGVVSLFASRNAGKIKRLVLWYPLIDYDAALIGKGSFGEQHYKSAMQNGYAEIVSKTTGKIFRLGKGVFEEGLGLKPYQELSNLDIPILFVHGTEDNSIDYKLSDKYSKLCKNSTLEIIEGGTHGFHDSHKDLNHAIKTTVNFLNNN